MKLFLLCETFFSEIEASRHKLDTSSFQRIIDHPLVLFNLQLLIFQNIRVKYEDISHPDETKSLNFQTKYQAKSPKNMPK